MSNKRLSRRTVIGTTALVLTGASATTVAGQQQPSVSASSPSCEQLQVAYDGRGGPSVTVKANGPETLITTLDPGETETLSAEPGTYTVTSRPENGSPRATEAVEVDGSPVTVERCIQSIEATKECIPNHSSGKAHWTEGYIINTLDRIVVITQHTLFTDGTDRTDITRLNPEPYGYRLYYAAAEPTERETFTAETYREGYPVHINGEPEFVVRPKEDCPP